MKRFFLTCLAILTLAMPCPALAPLGKSSLLGDRVVAFARARVGQKVGNGECWTLADRALHAAGAKRPGRDGRGPYVFGRRLAAGASLQSGDILQFENVRFEHRDGAGGFSWSEMKKHTAIVASAEGRRVIVYEQNAGNTPAEKRVRRTTLNLDDRVRGTITAYRPLPARK